MAWQASEALKAWEPVSLNTVWGASQLKQELEEQDCEEDSGPPSFSQFPSQSFSVSIKPPGVGPSAFFDLMMEESLDHQDGMDNKEDSINNDPDGMDNKEDSIDPIENESYIPIDTSNNKDNIDISKNNGNLDAIIDKKYKEYLDAAAARIKNDVIEIDPIQNDSYTPIDAIKTDQLAETQADEELADTVPALDFEVQNACVKVRQELLKRNIEQFHAHLSQKRYRMDIDTGVVSRRKCLNLYSLGA